jgi:hypothetical protein
MTQKNLETGSIYIYIYTFLKFIDKNVELNSTPKDEVQFHILKDCTLITLFSMK